MDEANFPEINTGNGKNADLIATSNDRLKKAVIEINALTNTVKDFNEQSSKQTREMLILTRVIAFLTFVMLVGLSVQIILAINP